MAGSRRRGSAGEYWPLVLVTAGCGKVLDLDQFAFGAIDAGESFLRPDVGAPGRGGASAMDPMTEPSSGGAGSGGAGQPGEEPAADGGDGSGPSATSRISLGWRLPCDERSADDQLCVEQSGRDPCPEASLGAPFDGDSAVVYDVVFRVAGVVEPSRYAGGTPLDGTLYRDGNLTDFQNQKYYELSISEPPSRHFLNHVESAGAERSLLVLDYDVTLPVRGGASVSLATGGSCGTRLPNCAAPAPAGCEPYPVPGLALAAGEQALFVSETSVTAR